jgi:hypothetical protein
LRINAVLFCFNVQYFSSSIFLFLVFSIFLFLVFSLQYSCFLSCSISVVQYSSFSNFLSFVFSTFRCSVSFYLLRSVFIIGQYLCSRCGSLLLGHIQLSFVMFSNFLLLFLVTSLLE